MLVQFGSAGAVIFSIILFLRFIREERKAYLGIIENHLTHFEGVLLDLGNIIKELAVVVRSINNRK